MRGIFASVAVASADDPFDPLAKINGNVVSLYRGYGMHIRYEGLRPLKVNDSDYAVLRCFLMLALSVLLILVCQPMPCDLK